jgi:2-C-methyl-D-erythritol 2,4-cyclodiphosphate synthase
MAPHIGAMRECIAAALGLPVDAVNVKAKTAEKLGPVGEGRSIETRAVCLIYKADADRA